MPPKTPALPALDNFHPLECGLRRNGVIDDASLAGRLAEEAARKAGKPDNVCDAAFVAAVGTVCSGQIVKIT